MARPVIWLANEPTVIVEGRCECAFDAMYNIDIGYDHRPRLTFTTDDVIPLSLRSLLITTSDRPTSVDVPHSPDTSEPKPIPAPIDSHERPW